MPPTIWYRPLVTALAVVSLAACTYFAGEGEEGSEA